MHEYAIDQSNKTQTPDQIATRRSTASNSSQAMRLSVDKRLFQRLITAIIIASIAAKIIDLCPKNRPRYCVA